jgi:hypothetical protein
MKNITWCIAAIRGIFDTDGMLFLEKRRGKLYPRIEIKQASQILSKQIYQILELLDFRVTKHIDHRGKGKWRPLVVISVRGHEMLQKWMKIIKPRNPKHIRKHQLCMDAHGANC